MALPFVPSDAGLLALQAGVVAAPRSIAATARVSDALARFRGPGWALVPVGSIVGVIFAIRYVSDTASFLTYLALIAVPILAAIALAWAVHGARPWFAALVLPLFVLAWQEPGTLSGEAAAALLSGLSCVTLGVLLAAVTPAGWLKAGIVAMAAADIWLVASDLLQHPNAVLVAAAPGGGLPQLQSEQFGIVSFGYGDLFVAALLGAVYSATLGRQRAAAVLTLALAAVFDLLFFVVDELPATVPVALALLILQVGLPGEQRSRAKRDRRLGRAAAERAP